VRVGLLNVDSVKIPNLALLKISAWHRNRGDTVEILNDKLWYDLVYASKVFTFSDGSEINAERMITGGTGIDPSSRLPTNIEACNPGPEDYELFGYPHSIGFTSRGCRNRCKFCVVPEAEPARRDRKVYSVRTIGQIWVNRDSRLIVLLDSDFFGQETDHWKARIDEIVDLDLLPCFSQGINIRLITEDQAAALARLKFRNLKGTKKQIHFAWDRIKDEKAVLCGIDRCLAAGLKPNQMAFYVLVGFDTTPEEDMYRVVTLRDLGCDPFVMPWNKSDPYQRKFARWVNHKAIFKTIEWSEYRDAVRNPT